MTAEARIPVYLLTGFLGSGKTTLLNAALRDPALANTAEGYAPRPAYRPLTKFENRGLKLGHRVWDIIFRRV